MGTDLIILIARHYHWHDAKMQMWFDEEEALKYELGVVFDERLVAAHPEINASLPSNNDGYC